MLCISRRFHNTIRFSASAILLLSFAVNNGSADHPPSAPKIVSGAWGGEHISLRASSQGAQIDLDCAHATITKPITLDSQDRFDVTGSLAHRGGAQPEGGSEATPARFTGYVRDGTMHLTMRSSESSEVLGSFILRQNAKGHIARCQ